MAIIIVVAKDFCLSEVINYNFKVTSLNYFTFDYQITSKIWTGNR